MRKKKGTVEVDLTAVALTLIDSFHDLSTDEMEIARRMAEVYSQRIGSPTRSYGINVTMSVVNFSAEQGIDLDAARARLDASTHSLLNRWVWSGQGEDLQRLCRWADSLTYDDFEFSIDFGGRFVQHLSAALARAEGAELAEYLQIAPGFATTKTKNAATAGASNIPEEQNMKIPLQKAQQSPQIAVTYAKAVPGDQHGEVSYSVQVARGDGVPMAVDEVKRVLTQALEVVQSEIEAEQLAGGRDEVDYVPSLMFSDPLIAVKILRLGRAAATAWYDSLAQMRSENELQVVEPASKLGARRLAEAGYLVALQEKGKFIVPSQHAHFEILPQPKGTLLLMGVPFRKEIFDALDG